MPDGKDDRSTEKMVMMRWDARCFSRDWNSFFTMSLLYFFYLLFFFFLFFLFFLFFQSFFVRRMCSSMDRATLTELEECPSVQHRVRTHNKGEFSTLLPSSAVGTKTGQKDSKKERDFRQRNVWKKAAIHVDYTKRHRQTTTKESTNTTTKLPYE